MRVEIKTLLQKPELIFVIITGFFGLLSALMMPILEIPDENQHFQISYAIFSANQRANEDLVYSEGMIVKKVTNETYWNLFTEKTSAQNDGFAVNTGSLVFDGKTRASIFDTMHITQALGVLVGKLIYPSLGVMVLFARLFVLTLFIASIYFIIKKVRYGKWVFVFIGTIPIIIQQAASTSYDAINMIAIFAWVAYIINLATQTTPLTRKQLGIGILLAVLLLVSKSNNVLLLSLIFALPTTLYSTRKWYTVVRKNKKWQLLKYSVITLLIAGVAVAFYVLQKKLLAGNELHLKTLLSVLMNTFVWGDLTLIDATTIGTIGQFGVFYYHLPIWIVILAYMILAIAFLSERIPKISRRFALISAALFFGSILLITIGMYYGWAMKPERLGPNAMIADGIQGRYFTPLLILLLPAFAYAQNHLKISTKNKQLVPIIIIITSIFLLTIYIVQTWRIFWS